MLEHIYKYPRLYLNAQFAENAQILLSAEHVHYLKNVIRKEAGDVLRVFNGKDGEWLASIKHLYKKKGGMVLSEQIKGQPSPPVPLCLFFSPIKKQRMDFLIEKSVELGVTRLCPVTTNRTENRKLNMDRMYAQIIEAAEQCERLDLPTLLPAKKISDILSHWNDDVRLYACLERHEGAKPFSSYSYKDGGAFLIGPEGGFDKGEIEMIESMKDARIVELGDEILRAETAALACLSYVRLSTAS